MSVVEQQAKELRVDVARGAEDGGQKADAVIVSIIRLILHGFLPGRFLQRLVDVGQVTKLAHLGRVVRVAPPLMSNREIKDQVTRSSVVMQKFPYPDITALLPPACCNRHLHAHFDPANRREAGAA